MQRESEAQCVQAITTAVNRELPDVSARLRKKSVPEPRKPASAQNTMASSPAIFSLRIDSVSLLSQLILCISMLRTPIGFHVFLCTRLLQCCFCLFLPPSVSHSSLCYPATLGVQ